MRTIDISNPYCHNIDAACKRLAREAEVSGEQVNMFFNDREIRAKPGMTAKDVHRCWLSSLRRDNRIHHRSPESKAWRREMKELQRRRDRIAAEGIKAFSIKDEPLWKSLIEANPDNGDIFRYIARFAHTAEVRMAAGEKLEDFAGALIYDADSEEIHSGHSLGWSLRALVEVWKHGERFRTWYNATHHIPAVSSQSEESADVPKTEGPGPEDMIH